MTKKEGILETMSMLPSIGPTHYTHALLGWKISCGQDKTEILFGRYQVSRTENFKYVTCPTCIANKECKY